jgi:hypothetical protein
MGQRRLDLVAEAARWLVERLGDRSASVTSSFPPSSWRRRRAVQRRPVLAAQVAGFGGVGRRRRVVEHVGAAWKAEWPLLLPPPHSRQRWWRGGHTWR